MFPPRDAAAVSILWTPPELLSTEAPETASVVRASMQLTNLTGGAQLGVIAGYTYPQFYGRNNRQYAYYERAADGTWSRQGTFMGGPAPDSSKATPYNTDAHFVFDAVDSVHAVFEAHHYIDPDPESIVPDHPIGYKFQGDAMWPDTALVWASESTQLANTPRLFLDTARDSLHVCWQHAGTLYYRVKSTDAQYGGSEAWGDSITVIDQFGAAAPIVVSDGEDAVLHLFGSKTVDGEHPWDPKTTYVLHAWGPPPGPSDSSWTAAAPPETLMTTVGSGGTGGDDSGLGFVEFPARGPSAQGPYIYYAQSPVDSPSGEQVITFRTLDTGGSSPGWWDPPLNGDPITLSAAGDGMDSGLPVIAADTSGIHVLWQDRPVGQSDTADFIFHRFTPDMSPTSPGDWTPIANVVADDPSKSMQPAAAVEDDVLLVAYSGIVDSTGCVGDATGTEVCYRHALFFREGHMFTDSTNAPMAWANSVFLDRDFVVPADSTLTILPGTVIELAGEDQYNRGVDAAHIEIIVRPGGRLVAEGTVDSTIAFRSATAGSTWYGIALGSLAGTAPSSLHHVDFQDALYAVTVDSPSGDLVHCTFDGTAVADVYLPQDTRIPVGYEWILDAPTRVLANDSSMIDLPGGETGIVDLIVEGGALETQRPPGGTGWVVFTSTDEDSASGDAWGGILVTASGTCTIRDADVGFARYAISLQGATDPVVSDSRVHHYKEIGIHDWESDAVIERCRVQRGAGLATQILNSGILLQHSSSTVQADTVLYHPNFGIRAQFSQGYCDSTPAGGSSPDTLRIIGNVVWGHDEEPEAEPGNPETGVSLAWLCHDNFARVEGDSIQHWSIGLSLEHCSDTSVRYEAIQDNFVGIQYERGDELDPAEGLVRLRENCIRSNYQYGPRSTSARGLSWGAPYTYVPVDVGLNTIRLDAESSHDPLFLSIDEVAVAERAENLVSGHNAWVAGDGTVLSDTMSVMNSVELLGTDDDLALYPLLSQEGDCVEPPSGTRRGPESAVAQGNSDPEDADGGARGIAVDLPTEWRLASARGNPVRGRIEVVYDVPRGYVGEVDLRIFDVTGRRVASLAAGPRSPGRYRVAWPEAGAAGVAPGVYFLRLEAKGYRNTRKLTLLR